MGASGRIYRIALVRTVVSAAVDLCEILTSATQVAWVHDIDLSQSSDSKDAEEQMLQLAWRRGNTTTGSGGNTVTPNPEGDIGVASGLTVKTFNTTKATVGTTVSVPIWDWNIRTPGGRLYAPEMHIFIPPNTRHCLELVAAPVGSVTICGTVTVETLG
jgi:hypothetical protein